MFYLWLGCVAQSGCHPSGHPIVGRMVERLLPFSHPFHCWVDISRSMGPVRAFRTIMLKVDNVAQTVSRCETAHVPEVGITRVSVLRKDTGGERRV